MPSEFVLAVADSDISDNSKRHHHVSVTTTTPTAERKKDNFRIISDFFRMLSYQEWNLVLIYLLRSHFDAVLFHHVKKRWNVCTVYLNVLCRKMRVKFATKMPECIRWTQHTTYHQDQVYLYLYRDVSMKQKTIHKKGRKRLHAHVLLWECVFVAKPNLQLKSNGAIKRERTSWWRLCARIKRKSVFKEM